MHKSFRGLATDLSPVALAKGEAPKAKAGFTLMEILLVVGICGVLLGLSIPYYRNLKASSDLQNAKMVLVRSLEHARIRAKTGENGSAWGVNISGNTITIFQGADYASSDPNEGDTTNFTPTIVVTSTGLSPANEVSFAQITGTTSAAGEFKLSHPLVKGTATVIIDEFGRIYQ